MYLIQALRSSPCVFVTLLGCTFACCYSCTCVLTCVQAGRFCVPCQRVSCRRPGGSLLQPCGYRGGGGWIAGLRASCLQYYLRSHLVDCLLSSLWPLETTGSNLEWLEMGRGEAWTIWTCKAETHFFLVEQVGFSLPRLLSDKLKRGTCN